MCTGQNVAKPFCKRTIQGFLKAHKILLPKMLKIKKYIYRERCD